LKRVVEGYFSQESAVRVVGRESVLMLGGGRALLMQVAHPLVAAGVHAHSDYAQNPWGRLARTMIALYSIVHGTRAEADRVAAQVRAVHGHVRGEHGGRRYSAFDADLMMWVHATLVDTGLVMYETFVRRLEPEVRESFYEDMKRVARIFGVPAAAIPRELGDFEDYKRALLAGDVLRVGDEARAVARIVLNPPVPAPLLPGFAALGRVTAALLPEELSARYGLAAGRSGRLALAASAQTVRRLLLPVLPERLRSLEPREGEPVEAVPPLRLVAALAR
jgi:uncharacterized protein (DUF2236 family)